MGILKRKIVDSMRSRAKRERYESLDEESDLTAVMFDESGRWKPGALPSIPPDAHVEFSELWQIVKHCLSTIPQIQADVFVLSVMEEMAAEQICEALDISLSNLWVRLHRARLGLARCVGAKWFQGEDGANRDE
jgi:RNA polymerase sigma-70 factor (ECF subfamily)